MTDQAPRATPAPSRVLALDALRGFDMFWITFAAPLLLAARSLGGGRWTELAARQLRHAQWQGLTFYDLIFPLFVFLAGAALPFALEARRARGATDAVLARHLLRRALVLIALGIFYNGGLAQAWPEVRVFGVLQRIAVSSLFAGLLYLTLGLRGRVMVTAAVLLLYWGLLVLVPFPGRALDPYLPEHNLAAYVDQALPLGSYYFQDWGWDPEGYLSALPAIATCSIGGFCGELLRHAKWSPFKRAALLTLLGVGCLALGYLWSLACPIIKNLWTSSFVLVTAGYSCLMLALLHAVIDGLRLMWWAWPLKVIGANSLVIYLAMELVSFADIAERLVGGDVAHWLGPAAPLASAMVQIALGFGLLWFLYARRIFVRA